MFLILNTSITNVLSFGLIFLAVLLTLHSLIIIPINRQIKQSTFIQNKLKPGLKIKTHDNFDGIVILVLSKTVVIERSDGRKIEMLKQSIKAINE